MSMRAIAATLTLLLAASGASAFVAPPSGSVLPDFDSRTNVSGARGQAEDAIRRKLETALATPLVLRLEPLRGLPKALFPRDPTGSLTPPSAGDPVAIARRFLAAHEDVYRLSAQEVA